MTAALAKPNVAAKLVGWDDSAQDYRDVAVDANGQIATTTTVAADIEIGAIEIKNDSDDTRAKVGPGSATNGLRVTESRSATISTVADTAVSSKAVVVSSDSTTRSVIIKSLNANTAAVRLGDTNVATNRGHRLQPGEGIVLDTTAAISAIAESGTQTICITILKD